MTALTDRIAEVLRQELSLEDFPGDQLYEGAINPHELAQRIAEALHLTKEWAIEFTDSLDNAPDRYEVLDGEPSKEIVDRCRSFPHRGIAHRWVSTWSAIEQQP